VAATPSPALVPDSPPFHLRPIAVARPVALRFGVQRCERHSPSMQSVPRLQLAYSAPGPPSSQKWSSEKVHDSRHHPGGGEGNAGGEDDAKLTADEGTPKTLGQSNERNEPRRGHHSRRGHPPAVAKKRRGQCGLRYLAKTSLRYITATACYRPRGSFLTWSPKNRSTLSTAHADRSSGGSKSFRFVSYKVPTIM
jgi:hypothetical protein